MRRRSSHACRSTASVAAGSRSSAAGSWEKSSDGSSSSTFTFAFACAFCSCSTARLYASVVRDHKIERTAYGSSVSGSAAETVVPPLRRASRSRCVLSSL